MAAVGVRADGQMHPGRVAGIQHLDVAGVEIAVDLQGGQRHGHVPGSFWGFVVRLLYTAWQGCCARSGNAGPIRRLMYQDIA
ncbi:hypothetical protein D3C85_1727050 [compost metagenome]